MNENMPKICAYCGKEITETDYRVFCPNCKSDYHKECWLANNGCVTIGCTFNRTAPVQATAPSAVNESNNISSADSCTSCGAPMPPHYVFCSKCGKARNPEGNSFNYPKDSSYYVPSTDCEISAKLIDKSSTYYLKAFDDIDEGTKKASFNVFACIFSVLWMLNRKMYSKAITFSLFFVLFVASLFVFPSLRVLTVILMILLLVFCGFCGNLMYMLQIDELTNQAKALPTEQRMAFINKKGGTLIKKRR
ncbi:MAG: RING finger protein [Acutalibacteraceae bacterium]